MFLFLGGDEDVVFVLALLLGTVPKCGHAIAVLLVREPLALVSQSVRTLADAEPRALVVLPLAHVRLRDALVHLFVLQTHTRESELPCRLARCFNYSHAAPVCDNHTSTRNILRGSTVGCGTALQAGRPRVRFPMGFLIVCIELIRPAALWP